MIIPKHSASRQLSGLFLPIGRQAVLMPRETREQHLLSWGGVSPPHEESGSQLLPIPCNLPVIRCSRQSAVLVSILHLHHLVSEVVMPVTAYPSAAAVTAYPPAAAAKVCVPLQCVPLLLRTPYLVDCFHSFDTSTVTPNYARQTRSSGLLPRKTQLLQERCKKL